MNMTVQIKKLHPDAVIPRYAHPGDSGFDLVAVEDVIIQPGKTAKVRTGLAFEIPPGYELQIRPRSGISAKTKLRVSNSPGTVDSSYRGEVCVLVDNIAFAEFTKVIDGELYCEGSFLLNAIDGDVVDEVPEEYGDDAFIKPTYIIRKGDRIAQGVIVPVIRAEFEVVDELSKSVRGADGFGSSGVRTATNVAVRKTAQQIMEKHRELCERLADE